MDYDRATKLRSLFDELVDKTPAEREVALNEACAGDPELRDEVESLLGYHDESETGFLRPPNAGSFSTESVADGLIGQHVGRYRILGVLGRGGMGVVYRAEQESPRREVALKVINPSVVSPTTLRRFTHEAEVLGRLQHTGIAQIYEAGTFDSGAGLQPFFAMEFVRGRPLTEFAKTQNLSTRARLGLMVQICRAVEFAHQHDVIHRDLKPSNILVTAEGEPKILDFGVARATNSDIQATTLRTDIGQLIGTVPYMSPEQAAGLPEELDTRSDVYALGVICYKLLADRLPYELPDRMILEAVRVIREEDPSPLSSINRALRGDVEVIVGKALEKDKARRYQSAHDLATDIEHYLSDEPIVARPPSTLYQFRKFARRNKWPVGGTAVSFVLLVLGLAGTGYGLIQANEARGLAEERERVALAAKETEAEQRRIAEAEAERALVAEAEAQQRAEELELVAKFQEQQLAGIDVPAMGLGLRQSIVDNRRATLAKRGMDEDAVERVLAELKSSLAGVNFTNVALESLDENIFERALKAIDGQFEDQPLVRARLLQTVAETLRKLGLLDLAEYPQAEALAIRRRELGHEHRDTLVSMRGYGIILQTRGRLTEAEPYYREALSISRRVLGHEHTDTLTSIRNLAMLLSSQGKLAEAEALARESLETSRRVLGDEHPDTLGSINNVGYLLYAHGKYAEAGPYWREALEARRRALGSEHSDTLDSVNNMGVLLQRQGRYADAEPLLREVMETRQRLLGEVHPRTLDSLNNLGDLFYWQGRLTEAEPLLRTVLAHRRRVLGDEHPATVDSLTNLGSLLSKQGRHIEAEPYYVEALETSQRLLGDEHPATLTSIHNVGTLLKLQDRFAEAEPYFRKAYETSRRTFGEQHLGTVIYMNEFVGLLRDLGRLDEAASLGSELTRFARGALPESQWHLGVPLTQHARTLAAMERFKESESLLLQAHAIFEATLGGGHERTLGAEDQLALLYDAWDAAEPDVGNDAKAAEWRAKLPPADDVESAPDSDDSAAQPLPSPSGD